MPEFYTAFHNIFIIAYSANVGCGCVLYIIDKIFETGFINHIYIALMLGLNVADQSDH